MRHNPSSYLKSIPCGPRRHEHFPGRRPGRGGMIGIVRVVLIASYELGRPPFGLASPAAWLRNDGFDVHLIDLSRQALHAAELAEAGLVAFYLPMHTATRLVARILPAVRHAVPHAHLCGYGLYAPLNQDYLRRCGMHSLLGGEFERDLLELARALRDGGQGGSEGRVRTSLDRLAFLPPDRTGLPGLASYATLQWPDGRTSLAAYTEASRGCRHTCRHCPIVPVYQGRFRIVPREVVIEDIRRQVAAGAGHVTFGDPDFFNGPTHAMAILEAMHAEFPHLTCDVTIKVEHLLLQQRLLPALRRAGCVLITAAVESLDDRVLEILGKRHTRADVRTALDLTEREGLALNPTFVSFTPWTTRESYRDLFQTLAGWGLLHRIPPIQMGIRLLLPNGSLLLDQPDAPQWLREFDEEALSYRWQHPDPEMDRFCQQVQDGIAIGTRAGLPRAAIFHQIGQGIAELTGGAPEGWPDATPDRNTIPWMNEPWFC